MTNSLPEPIATVPFSSQGTYPIYIGQQLLGHESLFKKYISGKQLCIVASANIPSIYLENLKSSVKKIPDLEQIDTLLVPDLDESKTIEAANSLWSKLIELGHRRDTTLIALGGGVIGDLVGFVASCYLRGVAWLNFPTTLLAQVDAAIGGKVAVNHDVGKNLIGSFYSPKAIFSDLSTLKTLTNREYRAGLAEVVKYGLALDKPLFEWLENHCEKILDKDLETLYTMISWCSKVKVDVVSKDFKESNLRMLLNFGHTLGHAIETDSHYTLRHGEAVSLGMCCAMEISKDYGLDVSEISSAIQLLEKFKLPTKLETKLDINALIEIVGRDKKNISDKTRFVVLTALGQSKCIEGVSQQALVKALRTIEHE